MDAFAWPLSIVGLLLVIFLVLLWRFPAEMRDLLTRFLRFEMSADGFAIQFMAKAVEEKEHRQVPRSELVPMASRIRKLRVLWVDDHPDNNRLEAQALRALGGEVDFATSNAEAVAYARANAYDIVVSDIGRDPPQPTEDGLALPERLSEVVSPLRLVYYVGHATAPESPDGHPVVDDPTELFDALGQLAAEEQPS
jgi:hypothetical protein